MFVIDDYVGGNDLVGLVGDLGPIALVGLVADIVGLTEVEVSWLVVVVMVGLKTAKWSARERG